MPVAAEEIAQTLDIARYSRIFLIANNPNIDNQTIHNLAISDNDLLVQFNLCTHRDKLHGCNTVVMFHNNHVNSAWGFNEDGMPMPGVASVIRGDSFPEMMIFSYRIPDSIQAHLPNGVPFATLDMVEISKEYPISLIPSIGFTGYLLFKQMTKNLGLPPKIYLIGFSGMSVARPNKVYHDFIYEQWIIKNDKNIIIVDPTINQPASRSAVQASALTSNFVSMDVAGENGMSVNVSGLRRRDDVALLLKPGGVGIELGVAEGVFSERILKRSLLSHLYSIDMYAGDRGHDIDQYRRAIKRLDPFRSRNTLIKMRFDEALSLFPDDFFDFIYVDGYAHTGEEGGATFYDWFPKLKVGGIFAGDDYSPNWPSVIAEVDKFIKKFGLQLHVVECGEPGSIWSENPTWFTLKQ